MTMSCGQAQTGFVTWGTSANSRCGRTGSTSALAARIQTLVRNRTERRPTKKVLQSASCELAAQGVMSTGSASRQLACQCLDLAEDTENQEYARALFKACKAF